MRSARSATFISAVILGLISLFAQPANAADALKFFKNYFLTGDYAVASVSLQGTGVNGFATGGITFAPGTVPAHADVLGAFLYWATVEHTPGEGSVGAKFNGADISKIAKSLGSGTPPCWSSGGATGGGGGSVQLAVYRADVLRFLPIDSAPGGTGKRLVNTTHTVVLADTGTGNSTPSTEGASLVVVYRDSPTYGDADMPLKSIVIYDGSYTMNQSTQTMTQTIQGFYDASKTSPVARLTHIVGSGQANKTERLLFNGSVIATNPFTGNWGNPTFNVGNLVPGDSGSATTAVDHAGSSTFDCLSWGAIIFSTTVQDTDNDGLLDKWETQGITDIATGAVVVNLPAMGADPNVKDIFVQVDYMTGAGHAHLPTKKALDMVAAAFKNSPVDGGKGIHIHFDVGSNYQTSPADPAIIPATVGGIPVARGGNPIPETSCPATDATCKFPGYPGTVSWKTGYRIVRDQYFAYNRKDSFHYALFAHTLGIPDPNNSSIPKSTSGVSDLLGGDLMVTLGRWDNQVGTDFAQAVTFFHELGHNLALRHGGGSQVPNCKPNYLSSMNYAFQMGGLLDANGVPTIDYSRGAVPSVNEGGLNDAVGFGTATLPYQSRWYVPFGSSILDNTLGTTAATRHCDGTSISVADVTPSMIRVDSGSLIGAPIDWNKNGTTDGSVAQDLDFNGKANEAAFSDYNDWGNIDLRQVGGRRNITRYSLAVGRDDLSTGDFGLGDFGLGDFGLGDFGLGDFGLGDFGLGDFGLGDFGLGDFGLGAALDFETATALGNAPNSLTVTVSQQAITINWNPPNLAAVTNYAVYRAVGTITATNLPVFQANVTPPATTYIDNNVKNNVTYTYLVVATFQTNPGEPTKQSGPSNQVTVKK